MNPSDACRDFREALTLRLAGEAADPGEHASRCADCARHAEQSRAVWELAGRIPDEELPPGLSDSLLRSCRRPRRTALTLLRPGAVAAAAVLAAGVLLLFRPAKTGGEGRQLMESDGIFIERYELPAGTSGRIVAEEIRREVAPEAWGEGGSGMEAGETTLRVRAPADVQRQVREYLQRRR